MKDEKSLGIMMQTVIREQKCNTIIRNQKLFFNLVYVLRSTS